jgi:hypothetical protein
VSAGAREEALVVGGQAATGKPVQEDRDRQLLGHCAERGFAVRPVQTGARHDDRPLGRAQQLGGALDAVRHRQAPRIFERCGLGLGQRALAEDVVERQVHERRPGRRPQRGAQGLVDQAGDLVRAAGRRRHLADGRDERDVVDLLQ